MHDKPLRRIADELTRRRPHSSHGARETVGPDRFGIDLDRAARFVDGTLGADDEARLAEEVAELLPLCWNLPNKAVETLTPIIDHLGGQRELMAWLDGHEGRPRLTARIFVLLGLLDRYTDDAAVLDTMRAARARDPFPAGLRGELLPETDEETLSSLAYRIEKRLADDEKEAVALSLATTGWLRRIADDADDPDPSVRELGSLMAHVQQDIGEAATPS
ncbi:hypothetical protein [Streptomyces cellostaticus]|uniref:hypothetical protein n=1 Tax=Streptomyces cellostaticus TaxID=67285 RepID=UPI0020264F08|nr:hypothetical protein [Streptomyces cellostaticus]